MRGRVDRRHLDRRHRLQPLRDRVAHDAVHMPFIDQRSGVAVVGAQDEVARIDAHLGHRLHLARHVVPGRTQSQHRLHALAHAGDGVLGAGALMVVRRAGRGVSMKGQAEVPRGIVAADRLSGPQRSGDLAGHHRIVGDDAGKVHHLAEPDDVFPAHRLGHVRHPERCAGILQPRCGGHAARHLDMHVDGHRQRFVMHQPDARQPKHIGDLVRVDEHGGRAVRDDRAAELRHRDHAALDMHVPVAEPRHEVSAVCLHHDRVGADGMGGIRPAVSEAAARDRKVGVGDDLAGMDVDPAPAAHDQIGMPSSGRDIDQHPRHVRPWLGFYEALRRGCHRSAPG